MTLAITDDHRLLAETARAVLERQGGRGPARQATDEGAEKLPVGWDEWVSLGWLGLHLPEHLGGQGFGLAELAVVIYEQGRVVAPGPLLPTTWAAAVVGACGPGVWRERLLPDIVAGRCVAAVGLGGDLVEDGGTLRGASGPVVAGGWADVVLVAVGVDIAVVERGAPGVRIETHDSLDRTRPLVTVRCEGVVPLATLAGAASTALDLGRVLAAAEAAGGAAACTELATAYSKEREQFGRPIGSFQAVKHHLANMFVDAEMATAAAWDAARAMPEDGQQTLAAAVAACHALPAFARNAKTSIQVHGGIGFTWEHDAHLYLRRAATLQGLFTAGTDPAAEVVDLSRAGRRRTATVELPPEAEAIREEVRAERLRILDLPAEDRRRELVDSGYLVAHWPRPWGRAADAVEQLVIDEELKGVGRPDLGIGGWVTLTIAQHGSADQLERWIRPSLLGELTFCQLFSEPNAGSDAAAIRTRGTRVDGGWVVNGQKVWTSGARECNRGFGTVRTDPDAPKHQGVSMMVFDLDDPGIEIRPIRQITGDSHFNEVWFTDVFVPDEDVVGEVNQGWKVARSTLGNEKVSIGGNSAFASPALHMLDHVTPGGRWDGPLGELIAEAQTMRAVQLRTVSRAVAGGEPGPEGNVTKLLAGEHAQRVTDLALRIAGAPGVAGAAPGATYEYLMALCLTIAGGTSEVIRNQIGERILGLPREPNLR